MSSEGNTARLATLVCDFLADPSSMDPNDLGGPLSRSRLTAVFVSSTRTRPLPRSRTTLPHTVRVPASASKSLQRSPSSSERRSPVAIGTVVEVFFVGQVAG